MVGRVLFLQQNDQKVPGAVLIPEVVALGLKRTWSLPTTGGS